MVHSGSLFDFICKKKSRANDDALTGFYQPVYLTSHIEIKELRKTRGGSG